jgi:hypothetical protein
MTILEELEQRGARRAKREGEARALLRQLAARFGSVPAAARARIVEADEATLARWSIRVLSEPSIDAVLDGAAPRRTKKAGAASRHARAGGAG